MPENACTSNTVTEDMNKVEEVLETERMEVDNPEPDEMYNDACFYVLHVILGKAAA
jgi:hypothetical protein